MFRKIVLPAGIIVIGAFLLFWAASREPKKYTGAVEQVRLGVPTTVSSTLIYIAEAKRFFKEYGLGVSTKEFQTGALAVDAMVREEVDVAPASGFVLVNQSSKRKDLLTFGGICATNDAELIIRADSGITRPEDLKGKKIGGTAGTIVDFYLETFLNDHGISLTDVQMINSNPAEEVEAFLNGNFPAAASFLPFSYQMKAKGGNGVLSWPIQGGRDYYFLLISKDRFKKARPAAVTRLLQAFIAAERFTKDHPEEAQRIVEERLKIDHAYLIAVWPKHEFRVKLDQELIIIMEDEARWAMDKGLAPREKVPNYLRLIEYQELEKIKPDAVSVIR